MNLFGNKLPVIYRTTILAMTAVLIVSCRTGQGADDTAATKSAVGSVPMLRFWRGFSQDRSGYPQFINVINKKLIPQTIVVNAGRGLIGYLPFVLPRTKPDFLPDEIALVAYSSAEDYQAVRSTPAGEQYGALHFEPGVFAKQSKAGIPSGSTLATELNPIPGDLSFDEMKPIAVAFGDQVGWQKGNHIFRAVVPPGSGTISQAAAAQFLSRWQKSMASNNKVSSVVLLITNRYVLEIIGGSDSKTLASAAEVNDRAIGPAFISKVYAVAPVQTATVSEGQGVNVLFQQ
jgi:hypothetical protein